MPQVCQCPSCKAKIQVGDQYAGRKIKCPKCSAAVAVPAGAAGESLAKANGKSAAATAPLKAQPLSAEKSPAASKLPVAEKSLSEKSLPGKALPEKALPEKVLPEKVLPTARLVAASPRAATEAEPVAKLAKRAPPPNDVPMLTEVADDEQPAAEPIESQKEKVIARGADGGLDFLGDADLSTKRSGPRAGKTRPPAAADPAGRSGMAPQSAKVDHGRKKKPAAPPWMIAAIAGGGVIVAAGIAAAVYFSGPLRTQTASAAADNGTNLVAAPPPVDPRVPQFTFTLQWAESDRAGATLKVNGGAKEVPAHGPVTVKLPRSDRPYSFVLQRPGYNAITFSRPLREDDSKMVVWEQEVSKSIAWDQDFKAAKAKAAAEHKNLFILFDASDAPASRFASERFAASIAAQKEFTDRCDREYVLLYIDNPLGDDAKKKVKDLARNAELTKGFRIGRFPTVVVADARARPYGIMQGYNINGINAFLVLMEQWREDRKTLFHLLDRIAANEDSPNPDVLRQAIDFLTSNELDQIYRATIHRWRGKLPDDGVSEVTEDEARLWAEKLMMVLRNPDKVHDVVAAFDRWKAGHSFKKHGDYGAGLDALAGLALAHIGDKDAAKKKCEEGFAYDPKDPRIFGMLNELQEALTGQGRERPPLPAGSGTGYCIAAGNYVMTNHHVIKDAKKIMVHLNGKAPKYAAHLVADNEDGDMAVLKIDLPSDLALRPIPFTETDVGIGDKVCAFGFPGLLAENLSATLTDGLISTIHDSDGWLVTNCKIEHGNSGGPLCSVSNCCIAGMVTAKTAQVQGLSESYGLAIPASQLKKFLAAKLPPDVRSKMPRPSAVAGAELSDVVKRIQGSVVYVENYQ